ncbi:hypothetical protein ACUV84_017168 [Puccinellia chinampoensis]
MASSVQKQRPMLVAATVALAGLFVAALADDARNILLHMYMHNIFGPPGQRVVLITKGTGPMNPSMPPEHYFGDTYAFDDLLTENRSESSKHVGRAQGTAMLASMRRPVYLVDMVILLTGGEFDGDTIVVEGRHDASQEERELAIVGGTGEFRTASGYVNCTTAREEKKFTVYELRVNATIPGDDSEPEPPVMRRPLPRVPPF